VTGIGVSRGAVAASIGKILFALDLGKHSHRLGWALATGIADIYLAALIFADWPSTAWHVARPARVLQFVLTRPAMRRTVVH